MCVTFNIFLVKKETQRADRCTKHFANTGCLVVLIILMTQSISLFTKSLLSILKQMTEQNLQWTVALKHKQSRSESKNDHLQAGVEWRTKNL